MLSSRPVILSKQCGNATVETILIATVMAPLLSGIPLIGKLADIDNSTTQASRYLAWEQTVARPGSDTQPQTELETEIRNRFYLDPDLQIRTNQQLADQDSINPMWTGYGLSDDETVNRLVDQDSSVGYTLQNDRPHGLTGTMSAAIVTMGRAMAGLSGGDWRIEDRGLYRGEVSIEVSRTAFLASGIDCDGMESESITLCISRTNTIFVDSWDAENAGQAGNRARTFVPAGALEPVGDSLAVIRRIIPFFADITGLRSDGNGGFGYVNPNVLPMDRYAED
ncbi:MAG: hypothetical protein AB2588_00235 [Candidatus Thiodiazotropha sp.]|nr:hypothetical protein [Candidatus Thiodiazotropha sp. (ex Lucina pensylvanica)]